MKYDEPFYSFYFHAYPKILGTVFLILLFGFKGL